MTSSARWTLVARVLLGAAAVTYGMEAYVVAQGTSHEDLLTAYLAAFAIRCCAWLALAAWTAAATSRARRLGWAVGAPWVAGVSWLIPLINLVAPFILVRRLGLRGATPAIVVWALAFGVGSIAWLVEFMATAGITTAVSRGAAAELVTRLEVFGLASAFVGSCALLVTTGLGVVIVGAVDRTQLKVLFDRVED